MRPGTEREGIESVDGDCEVGYDVTGRIGNMRGTEVKDVER